MNFGENFLIWLYVHFCWCENRMGLVIYTQYVNTDKKNIPALFLSCVFSSSLISFLIRSSSSGIERSGMEGSSITNLENGLVSP